MKIGEYSLIEHQLIRLRENGFKDIVINVGYLGEQIINALGDGKSYGVRIAYSREPQTGLETGGGVLQALPLLGEAPFLLTNADIFCDYPYRQLADKRPASVHLILVDNPDFKSDGDFSLQGEKLGSEKTLTFAGISVFNKQLHNRRQPDNTIVVYGMISVLPTDWH
ncbi:MAG: mannose-1-phosphate guanylyltransferase [Desulfobacterales bacterium]|nr:MAG: mannose-1-phosphate guanylyltransferase [Desulfobacterales bacterium]